MASSTAMTAAVPVTPGERLSTSPPSTVALRRSDGPRAAPVKIVPCTSLTLASVGCWMCTVDSIASVTLTAHSDERRGTCKVDGNAYRFAVGDGIEVPAECDIHDDMPRPDLEVEPGGMDERRNAGHRHAGDPSVLRLRRCAKETSGRIDKHVPLDTFDQF